MTLAVAKAFILNLVFFFLLGPTREEILHKFAIPVLTVSTHNFSMVVLVIDLIPLFTIFTETRFSRKFNLLASPNDLNVHVFSNFTKSYF